MGSRPASMDYGRRDMPLQGIAENRDEGVGAHPVNFDSGSEMGSEMGSRPGSEPASPRAGGKVGRPLLLLLALPKTLLPFAVFCSGCLPSRPHAVITDDSSGMSLWML